MTTELDLVFSALADPTRRKIIEKLKSRSYTIVELSGLFDMSLPAVSKHLKVLDRASLIEKEKEGKFVVCSYNPKPFEKALGWIGKQYNFWNEGFDSLEKLLDAENSKDKK
jgi:DNA-binding transcriptional ArsR family regulator